MIHMHLQHPRFTRWQARLARMPRWAWIAFIVGAVVPVVAFLIFLLLAAALTGTVVLLAVIVVGGVLGLVHRLFHRRSLDDGRRNVKIVVHSARVVDP